MKKINMINLHGLLRQSSILVVQFTSPYPGGHVHSYPPDYKIGWNIRKLFVDWILV